VIDCYDGKNIVITTENGISYTWDELRKITMNVPVCKGYRLLLSRIRNLRPDIKKRLFM
jgi:hypothetical protein